MSTAHLSLVIWQIYVKESIPEYSYTKICLLSFSKWVSNVWWLILHPEAFTEVHPIKCDFGQIKSHISHTKLHFSVCGLYYQTEHRGEIRGDMFGYQWTKTLCSFAKECGFSLIYSSLPRHPPDLITGEGGVCRANSLLQLHTVLNSASPAYFFPQMQRIWFKSLL